MRSIASVVTLFTASFGFVFPPAAPAQAPVSAPVVQEPGRLLRGRVVDERGRPIAGAAIAFVTEDWTTDAVIAAPQSRSGADGTFELAAGLAAATPGVRAVVVAAAGRVTARLTELGDTYIAFDVLAARGLDFGDLMLPPGALARGKVRSKAAVPIGGAVVELRGALQRIVGVSAGWAVLHTTRGRSGTDGAIALAGAPMDGATAEAHARGWYRTSLELALPGDPLLFELEPSGEVRGTLVDATGKPVVGIAVLDFGSGGLIEQRTAEDGTFAIGIELPGPFRVGAHRFDRIWKERWATGPELAAAASGVELRLPTPMPVRIAVRDRATGKPVAGAAVHADWLPSGWSQQAPPHAVFAAVPRRTDAAGNATFVDALRAQDYTGLVVVLADGFVPFVGRDLALPGKDEAIEAELIRAPAASGLVCDAATKKPIAGARIASTHDQLFAGLPSELPFAAQSDARGRFALALAATGNYRLEASAPGHRTSDPTEIDFARGGAGPTFALAPAFRLKGRLRNVAVGVDPAVRYRARATYQGSRYLPPAVATRSVLADGFKTVGSDGSFALEDVAGSTIIQLAVPALGHAGNRLVVDCGAVGVERDTASDFDLAKVELGRLRGRVRITGGDGRPQRFAVVVSNPNYLDGVVVSASLDAEGRFDIPVLPAWYHVRVVDVATGAAIDLRKMRAVAGAPADSDFEIALATVRVVVSGDPMQLRRCRLQLDVDLRDRSDEPRIGDTEGLDPPLALAEGRTEFIVLAPARLLRARLVDGGWRPKVRAEGEMTPVVGRDNVLELELPRR